MNRLVWFLCIFYGVSAISVLSKDEPPYDHYAQMARYIIHRVDWTAMGTISTEKEILGFPMVNVIAVSDSAVGESSTGQIYFLLVDLDFTGKDLNKNNQLTALFSMEQYKNCSDPMEPTCARIMMSGSRVVLAKDTDEYDFAYKAMISRHPAAENWIRVHNFYLCKLDITNICVLDYYGGPHLVSTEDYFKADPDSGEFDDDLPILRLN